MGMSDVPDMYAHAKSEGIASYILVKHSYHVSVTIVYQCSLAN